MMPERYWVEGPEDYFSDPAQNPAAGFTIECWGCHAELTVSLPRVFCPACRPVVAARADERRVKSFLEHPDFPMPGDRVRLRTEDDRAFERDVMSDLADL